jgi:hypothetical protein
MKKKSMLLAGAALLLSAAATPALAQSTIAPGMTTEQVRDRFGAPATTRAQGDWSYWYYHNGCPVRCGSDDVVFFKNGRVVTAVLRTPRRRYAGPRADDALQATDDGTSAVRVNAAPATGGNVIVGGVRVEGGTPPPADVIIVPAAPADQQEGTPVPAREGRPGEPSITVIERSEANIVAPTGPARGSVLSDVGTAEAEDGEEPAPAENTEATDTRGQTSIDRKNERNLRRNEETATERARRNDRRGNP